MNKLIVTILLAAVLCCGCDGVNDKTKTGALNLSLENKEETLSQHESQPSNQEKIINTSQPKSDEIKNEQEILHPIEIEEQKCMKKADYTTTGMSECSYKAMDSWFKEIDKYLGLLKTITSEEDYANILKSQENWKKYQESEFAAISIIMNKQGTIYQNILSGCETGLVKQRAIDLKNLYGYLME